MKIVLTIFFISLISCSTNQRDNQNPAHVNSDKNKIGMTCTVYWFSGVDSTNRLVAKSTEYFLNGNIATEVFNNYQGYNGIYQYYYQDTLLVKRKYASDDQDSTQTIYQYDSKGKLISEEHYDYERRLRTDIERKGDIVSEQDYETEKSWAKRSDIKYAYDSIGRRIEYYAPLIHWDNQNRYTWLYNESGKIKEHSSYDHERLIWKEEYRYSSNTINVKRTWSDFDKISQITRKVDNSGHVTEEVTLNKTGEFVNKTIYEYDDTGLIKKSVTYDKDDNPITTYIHVYEKNGSQQKL